jgi:hypothetical protein
MYPELSSKGAKGEEVAVMVAVGIVVVVCGGKGSPPPPPARWVCESSMQLKQGRETVCVRARWALD